MHILHNCIVHLNCVIEAIRSHGNLWGECHLPPCHLTMVPGFTTSFSIREIRLPWALLLTFGKTLASPASPGPPAPLPLGAACPYCSKTARIRQEKTFTFRNQFITPICWMLLHLFSSFPLDLHLKSINPVVSKAQRLKGLQSFSFRAPEIFLQI